ARQKTGDYLALGTRLLTGAAAGPTLAALARRLAHGSGSAGPGAGDDARSAGATLLSDLAARRPRPRQHRLPQRDARVRLLRAEARVGLRRRVVPAAARLACHDLPRHDGAAGLFGRAHPRLSLRGRGHRFT